jgi:hypothetical protein
MSNGWTSFVVHVIEVFVIIHPFYRMLWAEVLIFRIGIKDPLIIGNTSYDRKAKMEIIFYNRYTQIAF